MIIRFQDQFIKSGIPEVKLSLAMRRKAALAFTLAALFMVVTASLHAQWIPASLSKARYQPSATSAGSRAFFAGGDNGRNVFNTIDIYDDDTHSWSTDLLSEPRVDLASTSVGSKVFFAGGFNETDFSSVVDIYDINTKKWSHTNLTEARCELTATTAGTKAFFAGGRKSGGIERSAIVDIYDLSTNKWSVAHLSVARSQLAATSLGTKVFFAGGLGDRRVLISNVVDIYDTKTNTWTTHLLSKERYDLAAATVGNKVFFAGGISAQGDSDVVDIYDVSTNTWSTHRLSKARFDVAATTVGNKVFFAGGHSLATGISSNLVDIYDNTLNIWTTATLSEARNSIGATTVGTKAIFAGGWANTTLLSVNIVDIYETGKTQDTDPPRILMSYKDDGVANANGKIEVKVRITDQSRISYVLVNGEKRVEKDIADSLVFTAEFLPGEDVTIVARDNFNQGTEKSFVIKGMSERPASGSLNKKVNRKYYALIMAVQEYADPEIPSLNEPVRDATMLKNVLIKKYTFDEAGVHLLLNPAFEDIDVAFESLIGKVTSDDLLLIFYAGHGFFDEKTNIGYWLPSDATKKNKAKWYRNSALVENIRAINSKHTFLITDACFSGGIFKTRAPFNNASLQINDMLRRKSRKAMTSGSLETVPDKSIFMKYLLKALEENQNLYLTTEDLYDEINHAMKHNSVIKPDYGEIENTGDENGNFVFQQKSDN